jgi:hypothetical protein
MTVCIADVEATRGGVGGWRRMLMLMLTYNYSPQASTWWVAWHYSGMILMMNLPAGLSSVYQGAMEGYIQPDYARPR